MNLVDLANLVDLMDVVNLMNLYLPVTWANLMDMGILMILVYLVIILFGESGISADVG